MKSRYKQGYECKQRSHTSVRVVDTKIGRSILRANLAIDKNEGRLICNWTESQFREGRNGGDTVDRDCSWALT